MFRRLIATSALLVLCGCGESLATDGGRKAVSHVTPEPAHSLVVTGTYGPGRSGVLYIEGAMVEVILVDAHGDVVARKIGSPGKAITFAGLAPGHYQIKPALRPCDGNCGYLDRRTDQCRETISVPETTRVRVDFHVGARCSVDTHPTGAG